MDLDLLVWLNLTIVILNSGMCAWYLTDRQPVAGWRMAMAHAAIGVYAFLAARYLRVCNGDIP